jgi:hypothetical protein
VLVAELLLLAREHVSDELGLLSREEYVWRSWTYSRLPIEVLRLLGDNVRRLSQVLVADWLAESRAFQDQDSIVEGIRVYQRLSEQWAPKPSDGMAIDQPPYAEAC